MNKVTARALVAVVAATSLVALAGCASSGSGSDSNEKITLNVQFFGSFGYKEAGLYKAYEKLHPNITINESSPQNETDYWNATQTRLAGNSGLGDINAIEVGRIAGVIQNQSSKFVDLSKLSGAKAYFAKFLPWKMALAATSSGYQVGAGMDIGPVSVCYKPDLFKAAGLPTDPAAVSALWKGDWQKYVDVGKEFQAKAPSGTVFMDSAAGLFRGAMSATNDKYTDKSGKLIWATSPTVKSSFDLAAEAVDAGLSTKLTQFSPAWNTAFSTTAYASIICPGWMLTYIKGQDAKGAGNWAVADAPLPGDVGGTYLSIPKTSQHQAQAWDLIKFLTSASSQQAVFEKAGNFPSNLSAISAVASYTDPYFSNSPTGQILGDSAKAIPTPQIIGPHDNDVEGAIMNGVNEIAQKGVSPDQAWKDASAAIKTAVG